MPSKFDSLDLAALVAAAGLATAAGMAFADTQTELQHGYPLVAQDAGPTDVTGPAAPTVP